MKSKIIQSCKYLISSFLFLNSSFILAEEDSFIPLKDLKPLTGFQSDAPNHDFSFGLVSSNNYYADSSLPNDLILAYIRPYFKYSYKGIFRVDSKMRLDLTHNTKKPEKQKQTVRTSALENFSLDFDIENHSMSLGRRFFLTGSGVLFAGFADGLEYEFRSQYLSTKFQGMFSAQYDSCFITIKGCGGGKNNFDVTPNLAADSSVSDNGKRIFSTLTIETMSFAGSRLSLIGMYTKDLITEKNATGQKYGYNPLYFSGALKGYIINSDIRHSIDFYQQIGKTYDKLSNSNEAAKESNINAKAFEAELKWSMPFLREIIEPVMIGQFAWGEAEKDQNISTTSPTARNISGDDTAFYNFGSFSGGLALKPKLSNLSIYRIGFSTKPLQRFHFFRNLGFSAKFNYYQKNNAESAISDVLATEKDKNVGWGSDFVLIWDFRSDVKMFYSYGNFKPGKAYKEKNQNGENLRALRNVHLISVSFLF